MKRSAMPQSLGSILDSFLKDKGYDVAIKEWDVAESWPQIVGGRIAEVTECEKVENGVLYVKVMSAPWRQELSYQKDFIKEKIVKMMGCGTIKDIVFF